MTRTYWTAVEGSNPGVFCDWATAALTEAAARMHRYSSVDWARGTTCVLTPFAGPDGDLIDYLAGGEPDGGWWLRRECRGFVAPETSARVEALAETLGCQWRDGILSASIGAVATEQEAEGVLLNFITAAVALAALADEV